MKKCNKCLINKTLDQFCKNKNKKDGLHAWCKICVKEYKLIYNPLNIEKNRLNVKNYYLNNRDKVIKEFKDHYKINKEKYKKYYINHKDEIKIKKKEYNILNKQALLDYEKNRRKIDPLYRLSKNLRNNLWNVFSRMLNGKFVKSKHTEQILGCTFEEFKQYLESKFEPWMNWDNYGLYNGELNYGWDIDHIIPISKAKTENDLYNLNYYTNLQPLCSKINRDIKRNN